MSKQVWVVTFVDGTYLKVFDGNFSYEAIKQELLKFGLHPNLIEDARITKHKVIGS